MSRADDPAYDSEDEHETSEGEAQPCAKCGELPHYKVTSNPGWSDAFTDVWCPNHKCANHVNVVDGCAYSEGNALEAWDEAMNDQIEEAKDGQDV